MSELERLLLSSDDELERAMLGAVVAEAPSAASLRDTALALGLTASAATALVASVPSAASMLGAKATAVAASGGASAVAPPLAASSAVVTVGTASLGTLAKGLVGGALVSFVALTTLDHTLEAPTPAQPSVASTIAAPAAPPAAPAPLRDQGAGRAPVAGSPPPALDEAPLADPGGRRLAARAPVAAPPLAPVVTAPARAAFEADGPRPPAATARTDASLAAETRLLDRSRSALARGDTGLAAQLLAQYHAARPSGVLAHEAALLQLRLLLATGRRAAAAEQARRIISLYPENAHADSLRRLAAEP